EAVQLPRMREAVERTRNMEEPEAISAAALTEKPISKKTDRRCFPDGERRLFHTRRSMGIG
ncbi:hypothetical protein, partial [Faecalibacterium sp. DFI.5.82]|uniref:hypothetical protein n=1 Tax=Faecalibacterium sp. DFI.5.82 TaxID=3031725 RepID=UPI0023AECFA0